MGLVSREIKEFVYVRDQFRCQTPDCEETNRKNLTIHHIIPLSEGGEPDDPDNCELQCLEDQKRIHDGRPIEEVIREACNKYGFCDMTERWIKALEKKWRKEGENGHRPQESNEPSLESEESGTRQRVYGGVP